MTRARPVAALGRATLAALAAIGRVTLFFLSAASHVLRPPVYPAEYLRAAWAIGWASLPVVGLTALFTGAALALQIYAGSSRMAAEAVVPQIVAIGVVRELGPVMAGLMIAARVTSQIAAEIATMKVTEQIDALVTLSTNPLKFLVAPRLMAGLLTVPLLVGVGDVIGVFGGFLVATRELGFAASAYVTQSWQFLEQADIVSSLVKGAVFGLIAALMGCYHGINAGRGARGVGAATRASVEGAAILILAANFALTGLMFPA